MHDSASTLARRERVQGIQKRVPAVPMAEWRIKTFGQLPENLQRIVSTRPFLTTKLAAALNGTSISKLYEQKDAGYIRCYKDGGSTLWDAMSIALRLANLPAASSAAAPAPSTRRSRRQPISTSSPKPAPTTTPAAPTLPSPPTVPTEQMPGDQQ